MKRLREIGRNMFAKVQASFNMYLDSAFLLSILQWCFYGAKMDGLFHYPGHFGSNSDHINMGN